MSSSFLNTKIKDGEVGESLRELGRVTKKWVALVIVLMLVVSVIAYWFLIRRPTEKPAITKPSFQIPTIAADADDDNDGITNVDEVVLELDFTKADSDGDGIPDKLEPKWNFDTDGDGLINALDTDSDDDWLLDNQEDVNLNGKVNPGETDPLNPDTDNDGLMDSEELWAGTNPLNNDTDNDGVIDGDELAWNVDTDNDGLINALDNDSDGDGLGDGEEVARGTGILDPDSDKDGVKDGLEIQKDLDPLDADTDNDGLKDGQEAVEGAYWAEAEDLNIDSAQIKADSPASGGKAVEPKTDGSVFSTAPFGIVPAGAYKYYARVKAVSSTTDSPQIYLSISDGASLSDMHLLKFVTEEEVSDPEASPVFPSKLIQIKPWYMPLFIGKITPVIAPKNVYRWYSTPSFTLREDSGLALGVNMPAGDVALVDKILLVRSENLTQLKLTDPLNKDTDGDGLLDGEEMALDHWWLEVEDFIYQDKQIRDNAEVSNGKDIVAEPGTNRLLETPTTYCRSGRYLVYFVRALRGTQASTDIQLRVQIQYQLEGSETTLTKEKLVDLTDLYEWRYCGLEFKLETAGSFKITITQTKVGATEVVYVDKLLLARLPLLPPFEYGIFEPKEVIAIFDYELDNWDEEVLYEEDVYLTQGELETGKLENYVNSYTLTPQVGMAPVAKGRLVTIDVPKGGVDFSGKGVITADPMNPDTDEDGYRPDDGGLGGSKGYLTDGKEIDIGLNQFDVDTDDDKIPDPLDWNPLTDDCDNDGLIDGIEDSCAPFGIDDVNQDPNHVDGDYLEFLDDDTDDDGVIDGNEDKNYNAVQDIGELDPNDPDSDNDGINDGVELGLAAPQGKNTTGWTPDEDPETKTDPLDSDTDDDGLTDGEEDTNKNGKVDEGETDPNNPDTDGDGLLDGEDPRPLIPDYPDLCVSPDDISFSPPVPSQEQTCSIYATIHNVGIIGIQNTRMYIGFYDGDPDNQGQTIGWATILSLEAGGTEMVTITIDGDAPFWFQTPGAHTIYVKILTQVGDPHPPNYPAGAAVEETTYENNKAGKDIVVLAPPIADAGPDQGTEEVIWEDATVSFEGSGTDPDGGSITLYKWEFGDGKTWTSSTTGVTEHVYEEGGVYTARLTVTDDEGDWATDEAQVVIASKGTDSDGDTLADYYELSIGTDPNNANSDNDGDSMYDPLEFTVADLFDTSALADIDNDGLINILDPDSDDDGILDGDEGVWAEGSEGIQWYGTNPYYWDTDHDDLSDFDELNVYFTSPYRPDTDFDGLNDGDEVNVYGTNPKDPDSDDDGIMDGYDLQPLVKPTMSSWTKDFQPGMIRFTQEYIAYGIDGRSEIWKWVWNTWPAGHQEYDYSTGDAGTRRSVITDSKVKDKINEYWADSDYKAISAVPTDTYTYTDHYWWIYGADGWHWKGYKIIYDMLEDDYDVSFKNKNTTTTSEFVGWDIIEVFGFSIPYPVWRYYYYDLERISVELNKQQSVVVQFRLPSWEDHYSYVDDAHYKLPAFSYSLYKSDDFNDDSNLPIFQNIATAVELYDHCYEIEMRIPADKATQSSLWLHFMPVWLMKSGGEVKRIPMEPDTISFGALAKRIQISDTKEMMIGFEKFSDLDDPILTESFFDAPDSVDVEFLFTVDKKKEGGLADAYQVTFGARIDKIVNVANKICGMREQIVSVIKAAELRLEMARWETDGWQTAQKMRATANDFRAKGKIKLAEYVDDAARKVELEGREASKLAQNTGKYVKLADAMAVAEVGSVFATDGVQAALAFQEGDEIKGTLYTAKTALGTIKAVSTISEVSAASKTLKWLGKGKGQAYLAVAIGTIQVGINIWESTQTDDEIVKLACYEGAAAGAIDTGISLIPVYGQAIKGAWTITITTFSYFMPNELAESICSSPGSTIVFLFEYIATSTIPSQIAEDAYKRAAGAVVDLVKLFNEYGTPSIWIEPE